MKTIKVTILCTAIVALCATFATNAKAQCGFATKHNQAPLAAAAASVTLRTSVQDAPSQNGDEGTVVGLWDVKFMTDDQLFDEGFDQYHTDGTEILNDTPPPATGNVCLGVWAKTGPRSYKLKHPFWIFDATNTTVIGRGVILEQITLDRRGRSFTGTFTLQTRDLFDNPIGPDVFGQLRGDRITVD